MRLLVCSVLRAARAKHPALAQGDEVATLEARIPQLMIEGKRGEAITVAEQLTELTTLPFDVLVTERPPTAASRLMPRQVVKLLEEERHRNCAAPFF